MAAVIAPHGDGWNWSVVGEMIEGRMCEGGVDAIWIGTLVAMGIVVQEKGMQ
jgi:hypothetical protein